MARRISVLQLALLPLGVLVSLLLLQLPTPSHAFLLPKIIRQGRLVEQLQQVPIQSPLAPLYASEPKRLTVTEQLKFSPNRWKRNGQPLEPGFGGIWPGKPDAKTYKVSVAGCMSNREDLECFPLNPLPPSLLPSLPSFQIAVVDPRTKTNYTMDVPEDRYIFFAFEKAAGGFANLSRSLPPSLPSLPPSPPGYCRGPPHQV